MIKFYEPSYIYIYMLDLIMFRLREYGENPFCIIHGLIHFALTDSICCIYCHFKSILSTYL